MLEPGTVIANRYKLLRLVATGGMGAVYEGEHTGVGRRVAIKVLQTQYASNAAVLGRFVAEARAAAAIGHENIVDILDIGTHEGQAFIVMELLKGESLASRIERTGKLGPDAAAHVMQQTLSALRAAHAMGIVHRDLKPDNVFLTNKAGVTDFVKLLDFGVSKFTGEGQFSRARTRTSVIGTPLYMSPEQATARRDVDPRADIYSAGVMLYEMTTGQVPFEAESTVELLATIIFRPAGELSARDRNPSLSPEFEAVIAKAMAKEREDRFQGADEFADALAPWIVAQSRSQSQMAPATSSQLPAKVVTMTPSPWEKATSVAPTGVAPIDAEWRRRNVVAAFVLCTAGILLAALIVFAVRHDRGGPSGWTVPADGRGRAATSGPSTRAESTIAIDLTVSPADATIELDGERVGRHLVMARGSRHTLAVIASGRVRYEAALIADRDREIVVALATADAGAGDHAPTAEAPARSPRDHRSSDTDEPRTRQTEPAGDDAPLRGSSPGASLPLSNEF